MTQIAIKDDSVNNGSGKLVEKLVKSRKIGKSPKKFLKAWKVCKHSQFKGIFTKVLTLPSIFVKFARFMNFLNTTFGLIIN